MAFDRRSRRRPLHVARGNAYAQLELEGQLFARKGICLAQHDQNIVNDTGAAVRTDINNALVALFTLSSGAAAPSTTIAYMLWADTTNGLLKQRNAANTGWLVRGTLAETFVLARSSNTIVGVGDFARTLNCTGTFTQTLTAAATLGDGFMFYIRNNGTGVITIDPNGSETIDGATTIDLAPGEGCAVFCNGSAFVTMGRSPAFLQWTSFKNRLLNPHFQIDQRNVGASTAVADDAYCFDRWYVLTQTASVNVSQQTAQEDGTPFNIRLTQNQASTQHMDLAQIIEGKNCKDLRGKASALSIRARISNSQAIRYAILEWTGTEDSATSDVVNDWTSSDYGEGAAKFFVDSNITITAIGTATPSANTWTTLATLTGTLGSSLNNIIIFIWTEGTAAQNVTLDLGFVQYERGPVATEVERRPYQQEFRLCQRHLWQIGKASSIRPLAGVVTASTQGTYAFVFPQPMRASPTMSLSAASDWTNETVGGSSAGSSSSFSNGGTENFYLNLTSGSHGGTTGDGCFIAAANANAYIRAEAEL